MPHGIELVGTNIGPGLTISDNIFRGGSIFSPASNGGLALAVCAETDPSQQFEVTAAGTVMHQPSGMCVQSPSGVGGQLVLATCRSGAASQQWAPVVAGAAVVLTNGQSGGNCVSFNNANGNVDVGNPVITWACGTPPAWNELWAPIAVGAVGAIQALDETGAASNHCLAVTSAAAAIVVTGTRIEGNSFTGRGAATRASLTLTQTAATQWKFDFCSLLVFPTIDRVNVFVSAASGFPVAIARPPINCTVLVETSEPVTGSVTAVVDSSKLSTDFL